MKYVIRITSTLGVVCGIAELGFGIFAHPFNSGDIALGLIFLIVNGIGGMIAWSV